MKTKTIVTIIALAGCGIMLAGCSDDKVTRRVLADNGYTDIQTTGYSWLSCDSKSDTFSTGFKAKSPNGREVKGAVCSGWLKGATIRFF